jgi:hypothetical protein
MKWTDIKTKSLYLHHRTHSIIGVFLLYQQWFWQYQLEGLSYWYIGRKCVDTYDVIRYFKELMLR